MFRALSSLHDWQSSTPERFSERGFMTGRKRVFLALLTIVFSIGCDQATKTMAKAHLLGKKELSYAGGALKLDFNVNEGASFSFEDFLPEQWRGRIVSVAAALFLGILIFIVMAGLHLRPLAVTGLSLFCGGSLSNLLDRVAFGGNVVDFLSLGWGGFRTAIFNVADAAIAAGLILFAAAGVWSLLRRLALSGGDGPGR
jgi:signal peptidase II